MSRRLPQLTHTAGASGGGGQPSDSRWLSAAVFAAAASAAVSSSGSAAAVHSKALLERPVVSTTSVCCNRRTIGPAFVSTNVRPGSRLPSLPPAPLGTTRRPHPTHRRCCDDITLLRRQNTVATTEREIMLLDARQLPLGERRLPSTLRGFRRGWESELSSWSSREKPAGDLVVVAWCSAPLCCSRRPVRTW